MRIKRPRFTDEHRYKNEYRSSHKTDIAITIRREQARLKAVKEEEERMKEEAAKKVRPLKGTK